MTWLWLFVSLVGVGVLLVLVYWQFGIAEGTYLGPRVVAWTYDLVARRYDGIKQFNPSHESWFLAEPVLSGMVGVEHPLLLDVATGTGRLPLTLLRGRFGANGGRIVGLDLSRGMLRQARAKLRTYDDVVCLLWQDASHLPFEDGAFDAVTCLESLEFMPRPLKVLSEMVRVLVPGGLLLLTNRVGHETRFLPGRAIPRPAFEEALAALPLRDIKVRPWQVQYDLAVARKVGARNPVGRGAADFVTSVRCPGCGGPLQRAVASLSCAACERSYPIREGLVYLAAYERRGER
jgi:ubiquinone/menaquinone biosynthesis C-methylase UbiE